MKLQYLSAVLICLFLLCISVPNLFAQNLQNGISVQNGYFENKGNLFIQTVKSDKKKESILRDLKEQFYFKRAHLTKYGVDLISLEDGFEDVRSIRLRTGFSSLSKNASAGVQLIISW